MRYTEKRITETKATITYLCIEFNCTCIFLAYNKVIIIPRPHVISDVYFEKAFMYVELLRRRIDFSLNFLTSRKVIFKGGNSAGPFFNQVAEKAIELLDFVEIIKTDYILKRIVRFVSC